MPQSEVTQANANRSGLAMGAEESGLEPCVGLELP